MAILLNYNIVTINIENIERKKQDFQKNYYEASNSFIFYVLLIFFSILIPEIL